MRASAPEIDHQPLYRRLGGHARTMVGVRRRLLAADAAFSAAAPWPRGLPASVAAAAAAAP